MCAVKFARVVLRYNVLWVACAILCQITDSVDVDPKGYILYCPCMGRFGNQADHFLGALAFAERVDRTLVLPPWVEYRRESPMRSTQVPFDTYFKVDPLREYHRVMTMDTFMEELAPTIWPPGNRTVFCYQARQGDTTGSCNAKDGNPFGPFWDTFDVDFDHSEFYGPLYFETSDVNDIRKWKAQFPPSRYLVIAFTGAPANFPVQEKDIYLHKYLHWSGYIDNIAETFIRKNIPERPYLGIHLRTGSDWENACQHVRESPLMFAAPQCLGYRSQNGKVTKELCFPSVKTIVNQVNKQVTKMNAKAVFVATDDRDLISEMAKVIKGVKFTRFPNNNPHVDLCLLAKADHYIGNCVSTFSAFAKRQRDAAGKPTSFWAFPLQKKDEL